MERKWRMYGLVPYNISPIQQGIQFGHAVVEYGQEMKNYIGTQSKSNYEDWADNHKTFIILNGGTTNKNEDRPGTLNEYRQQLFDNNILFSSFFEPDLGDQLTAVVFLVDDRVWDKKAWPDYSGGWISNFIETKPDPHAYNQWKEKFGDDAEQIVWLREFLSQFKLA